MKKKTHTKCASTMRSHVVQIPGPSLHRKIHPPPYPTFRSSLMTLFILLALSNWSRTLYMMSVRNVYFVPLTTSSPLWIRRRCWNSRTRPAFGVTSIRFVRLPLKKVVAPPSSCFFPSFPSASLRYRCRVKYERSVRSGVSYEPSQ